MPPSHDDDRTVALRTAARALLGDVRDALVRAGTAPDRLAHARRASADLDDLFMIVLVGEFNAGKSALINVLLGGDVLREGVTPTTDAVTIVRQGEPRRPRVAEGGVVEVFHPAPLLRDVAVVDTPGTNAIVLEHERLTRELVPRSDLILFVTSADRPFPESERQFLTEIRRWDKPIVVLLNKADLLGSPADLDTQLEFIERGLRSVTKAPPPIVPISARLGRAALDEPDSERRRERWVDSGFAALERLLDRTLADQSRLALKLSSPLGVAARLLREELAETQGHLDVILGDLRVGEDIGRLIALYAEDVKRDARPRLAEIEHRVDRIEARGERFFDDVYRIERGPSLFKSDAIRERFEREVIADTASAIQERVGALVEWLVDQDARLWRSVADELERRARAGQERQPDLGAGFDHDRRVVLQSVVHVTQDVIRQHERTEMPRELATALRRSAERVLLFEAGALGLGTAVVALVSSSFLDITGITAAAVLAGVGMVILPLHKRRAKGQLREEVGRLRDGLVTALRTEVERQIDGSVQRLRDALAPYDRFVRAEQSRLEEIAATLSDLGRRVDELRVAVQELAPNAHVEDGTRNGPTGLLASGASLPPPAEGVGHAQSGAEAERDRPRSASQIAPSGGH